MCVCRVHGREKASLIFNDFELGRSFTFYYYSSVEQKHVI